MIYDTLKDDCDNYIRRCEEVLLSRSIEDAKNLRSEATIKFHSLIPRWNSGLMASITHFYLDDIENIHSKLTRFSQDLEDDAWQPEQSTIRSVSATSKGGSAGQLLVSSFDQTINWVRNNMSANATHRAEVLDRVQALQALSASRNSSEKWEQLKDFLEWIKVEDAGLASRMLPLFAEVMDPDGA